MEVIVIRAINDNIEFLWFYSWTESSSKFTSTLRVPQGSILYTLLILILNDLYSSSTKEKKKVLSTSFSEDEFLLMLQTVCLSVCRTLLQEASSRLNYTVLGKVKTGSQDAPCDSGGNIIKPGIIHAIPVRKPRFHNGPRARKPSSSKHMSFQLGGPRVIQCSA